MLRVYYGGWCICMSCTGISMRVRWIFVLSEAQFLSESQSLSFTGSGSYRFAVRLLCVRYRDWFMIRI